MANVLISRLVLESIKGVDCESTGPTDLANLDRPEKFCLRWLRVHDVLPADESLVRGFQQRGISAFEAQRRAAAELAADAWRLLAGDPKMLTYPVPRYAHE